MILSSDIKDKNSKIELTNSSSFLNGKNLDK